jgi:flavin reductase (DIM6/NTAB) family NADH-FMN oxidoreductase RutF
MENKKFSKEYWQAGNMLYPLPAVMVSCRKPGDRPNIITVAWTGTICSDPAMVYISVRPERYSYDIIKETGEFVINLTTEKLAKITDLCGVKSGRDIDKFREYGLTEMKSKYVKAPSIGESPVNIECRVREIIPLGSHDMFISEVLGVTVDSQYMDESGKFDLAKARPLVYSHGEYFAEGRFIGKFGHSVKKKGKKRERS